MAKKEQDFETKRKQFVTSSLRRASLRWYARSECLKLARVERGLYKCSMCEGLYKQREIDIDHIKPVVSLQGFTNWDDFINRLLCRPEELQALCKSCHFSKSLVEDATRASFNAQAKEKIKKNKKNKN
jgi:hypothetical protein